MGANPNVVEDERALWSSSYNPIMTYVEEGWCHGEAGQSDGDTEIMTTPEFWENLINERYLDLANGSVDVDPTSLPARTGPPTYDAPGQAFDEAIKKFNSVCDDFDRRVRMKGPCLQFFSFQLSSCPNMCEPHCLRTD